jgi:hypothetical protein
MLESALMPEEGARMPVIRNLWARGRAVPWAVVWEVSRSLWANARDRINETLSSRERQDFGRLVRKGRGRPWTLTGRERRRLVMLMKKAATGESDSSWDAVGRSLLTLLPPRILTSIWERQDFRR